MKTLFLRLLIIFLLFSLAASACDKSPVTLTSFTNNGNGTYTAVFNVCVAKNTGSASTWGFFIKITGANILNFSPPSITSNATGDNQTINGVQTSPTQVDYGTYNNTTGVPFVTLNSASPIVNQCWNITVVLDAAPTGWQVEGQEYSGGVLGGDCSTTGGFPNPTIPIKLLSFNGIISDKGILLSWQTASESNNSHFTIESAANNKDYTPIGTIKGAGNSAVLNSYLFIDSDFRTRLNNHVGTLLYYRLKQTDYDGKYTYSKVLDVQPNHPASNNISYSPNPIKPDDDLIITYQLAQAQDITVYIYSAIGTVKSMSQTHLQAGVNTYPISLKGLPAGMYYMKTIFGEQVETVKILVEE